jgi:dTDP-4-dehydrorhamnose 3,5-epimerase
MPEVTEIPEISGVRVIRLVAHEDARGRYVETWRREWVPGAREMVQGNRSRSHPGVLRAFHYHMHQTDYWYLGDAHVQVSLVDVRGGSATGGRAWTIVVAPDDEVGLYIPPGVAHGFYAIGPTSLSYMVDRYYTGTDELGIAWDDPEIGVTWPSESPVISDRDRNNPRLSDIPPEKRP